MPWHGAPNVPGNAISAVQGPGIVNIPPFSVSASGPPSEGLELDITAPANTFNLPTYGSGFPQLFDTVAHQYSNGIDLNAYAGFADGTDIAFLVYAQQSKTSGSPTDIMRYYTSRPTRTPRDTAVYGTENMQKGKGVLGFPTWPAAWGTQNNPTLYVDAIFLTANPYNVTGGNGGDANTKQLRFTGTTGSGGGSNAFGKSGGSYSTPTSGAFSGFYTITGLAGQWTRFQAWLDLTNGIINPWWLGKFLQWDNSGVNPGGSNHQFEACLPADVLYAPNAPTNVNWTPNSQGFTYDAVCMGQVGFDDGHGVSVGNNFYIQQVFVNPDVWRFELRAPGASIDLSPTSTQQQELQGRFQIIDDAHAKVWLRQGTFSSFSGGNVLTYVNARNSGLDICSFP